MENKKIASVAKRIVLGKNKPTPILRFICWFTIIWDLLIMLYMLGSGLFILVSGGNIWENSLLKGFSQNFCFFYAALHGGSLLSAILMYRLKKSGFILYSISNITMVVSTYIFIETLRADYFQIGFTLLMIGLFATQLKKLS